jgi:hypothetical protein
MEYPTAFYYSKPTVHIHIYSWLELQRHRLLLGGHRSARVRLVHAPTSDFYENNKYSRALL